jgi:hypothetical protein
MDSDEICEFVSSALSGIKKATDGNKNESGKSSFVLTDKIQFEISTVTEKKKGGGLKIHIVAIEDKHISTNTSKIIFSVGKTGF